jgi:hypothetical protein
LKGNLAWPLNQFSGLWAPDVKKFDSAKHCAKGADRATALALALISGGY